MTGANTIIKVTVMMAGLRELCIGSSSGRFKNSPKVEKRKTHMHCRKEQCPWMLEHLKHPENHSHSVKKERIYMSENMAGLKKNGTKMLEQVRAQQAGNGTCASPAPSSWPDSL